MKISNRRIVLLTGASVSVLGVAAPAQAATVINPGTSHSITAADVNDSLEICAIGSTCDYGSKSLPFRAPLRT